MGVRVRPRYDTLLNILVLHFNCQYLGNNTSHTCNNYIKNDENGNVHFSDGIFLAHVSKLDNPSTDSAGASIASECRLVKWHVVLQKIYTVPRLICDLHL